MVILKVWVETDALMVWKLGGSLEGGWKGNRPTNILIVWEEREERESEEEQTGFGEEESEEVVWEKRRRRGEDVVWEKEWEGWREGVGERRRGEENEKSGEKKWLGEKRGRRRKEPTDCVDALVCGCFFNFEILFLEV